MHKFDLELFHRSVLTHLKAHFTFDERFQVHVLDFKSKGNDSLIRWAISPAGSAEYISNASVMVSFCLLELLRSYFP